MHELLQDKSEKKVEYIELIYDLIFVYLISRNGDLLHTVEGGFITPMAALTYAMSTLIILQIWYFSTLLINRYGCGGALEYLCLFVNMYLLYYMADGIRADWGAWYFRYNSAWALILLNLAFQYFLRLRHASCGSDWERQHMKYQLRMLVIEAAIILISIPLYAVTGYAFGPWGMVFGFVTPLITRKVDALVPVDFPHLSERVMLYVVFTFGEMILAIVGYFSGEISGWTVYYSLMAFLIVAGLFTSYGHFYDHLLDRELTTTGTGYMLLHVVLIFSLNNITAGLEFMREPEVAAIPKNCFMVISVLIFFLCLLLTQRYASKYIAEGRRFYWKLALNFAVFCALTMLCYRWSYLAIALTVAFIYMQLYALRRAGTARST